jgi:hypothetical protein
MFLVKNQMCGWKPSLMMSVAVVFHPLLRGESFLCKSLWMYFYIFYSPVTGTSNNKKGPSGRKSYDLLLVDFFNLICGAVVFWKISTKRIFPLHVNLCKFVFSHSNLFAWLSCTVVVLGLPRQVRFRPELWCNRLLKVTFLCMSSGS